MSIFSHFQQRFESTRQEEFSLQEYLELCKQDRSAYVSAAERLLLAIGEPELLDTSTNSRLSRIFSNKVIRRYPAFAEFYGMEEVIAAFDAVRNGGLPPLAVEGCNGYWHGRPGMLRAEELGVC